MAPNTREHDLLFYDGYCALCHFWVKRVMRHDPDGAMFRYAPLQGETIGEVLSRERRDALPDSLVVLTTDGRLLTRSRAVTHLVDRLGRPPGLLVMTLAMRLPRPVADGLYRGVARVRHRVFGRTAQACPMLPPALRHRVLP